MTVCIPIKVTEYDIPMTRKVLHKQQIVISRIVVYDIELSWHNIKFYFVVRRRFLGKR